MGSTLIETRKLEFWTSRIHFTDTIGAVTNAMIAGLPADNESQGCYLPLLCREQGSDDAAEPCRYLVRGADSVIGSRQCLMQGEMHLPNGKVVPGSAVALFGGDGSGDVWVRFEHDGT